MGADLVVDQIVGDDAVFAGGAFAKQLDVLGVFGEQGRERALDPGLFGDLGEAALAELADEFMGHVWIGVVFDPRHELQGGMLELDCHLGVFKLGSVDDVGPVDEVF